MIGRALLAVLVVLVVPVAAQAQDPAAGTPAWYEREAGNYLAAQGRAQDWAVAEGAPAPGGVDPRRAIDRWNGARGEVIPIEYRNRYDARIAGHLWRPSGAGDATLPAVVFVSGYGSADDAYFWAAQDLAEHGYLVMTFDPQGAGGSDARPAERYCEPGGAWTEPQEMGIREQGACAGQDPDDAALSEYGALGFVVTGKAGDEDATGTATVYRKIAPRFVFGTLDAAAYLLSDGNPWRRNVDPARVGVAGHSAGAWTALMVASGDPQQRFRAAVALDGYHGYDYGVTGRAPTLIVQSEQENVIGPRTVPPSAPRDPGQLHATRGVFGDLQDRGIDTGFYALRGSTHNEFTDVFTQASRKGQRVASHLMLAWFDAQLRGRGIEPLYAERLDGTVDASSIGTGGYRIGGERLADHLSFYYPSDLAAAGVSCPDLRVQPCAGPPPAAPSCRHRPRGRKRVGSRMRAAGKRVKAGRAQGGRWRQCRSGGRAQSHSGA